MTRTSKREIRYSLEETYEDMTLAAKQKAQAELDTQVARSTTAAELIKEWEEVTADAKDGYALELWLQKQSDLLKRRADIKRELAEEVHAYLAEQHDHEQ